MSRIPQFPTRHRSPSTSKSSNIPSPAASSTRPLQISRPTTSSRPDTPNNQLPSGSPGFAPPNTAPVGPTRPQRSELRGRVSENFDSERASTFSQDRYRDSVSTTRSDISASNRWRTTSPSNSQPKSFSRIQSPHSADDDSTPTSLTSALSAFQSAGSRMRQRTIDSDDFNHIRDRDLEIQAEKLRQQRIRDKVPGLSTKGSRRTGDIDAVLDRVKDGWEFVIDPDFNSVDLALQLLDTSSLGKDIDSFRRTKQILSNALKGSVDKYYEAFAASLPHHASLLTSLGATQQQITQARASIIEAKEALGNRRADLVQLWSRGQTLEEMIQILDHIEHLKSVPDLLETLMSEKRLLQASVLLLRSLKVINKPDMLEIGALSDLRSYLNGQETALREILIDELQSHLYLKSFWCETRWCAYTPNQNTFARPEFEADLEKSQLEGKSSPTSPSFRQTRLNRFLNNLALRPNDPPHDLEEHNFRTDHGVPSTATTPIIPPPTPSTSLLPSSTNINPEADSFMYMETLLESLAVLGKLGTALDIIAQRLPGEIFTLVETTIDEVEERAEFSRNGTMLPLNINGGLGKAEGPYIFSVNDSIPGLNSHKGLVQAASLRLSSLESSTQGTDQEILRDLFWTLYSKLDAVAQGLRVVSEISSRIGSRRDFRDATGTKLGTLFSLAETWNPIQAEVRNLIQDYLTDEQQAFATSRNPIISINEILRDGKFIRDKTKPVFRFSDTDLKQMNKVLKSHEDELTQVLKDTVPGLVPGSTEVIQVTVATAADDRILGLDHHHRLLIQPDAFHVTALFKPSLAFLQRIADVLPSGLESAKSSTAVLDEFVLKVYLPQLEEKVSNIFHRAVSGTEAFEEDPLSLRLCTEPLLKACTHLIALINSLCVMLDTSPFHRENYSRLILGVVIQFYQRCSDRFQALTTVNVSNTAEVKSKLVVAAQWAQKAELHPCLSELLSVPDAASTRSQQLCHKETSIELEILGNGTLNKDDLIPSVRDVAALATLYRSVVWFLKELRGLKSTSEDVASPTSPQNLESLSSISPYSPDFLVPSVQPPTSQVRLPLSREMSLRFQALLKTYEQLSGLILDSIRIDLRCRTIFYLRAAMRHGLYFMSYEAAEPDPNINDLNAELVKCDELIIQNLPLQDRHFVFAGLGSLMEDILISEARNIGLTNAFGIKKIMRNTLALQQCINTLTNNQKTEFDRVKHYYSLFFITPTALLEQIQQKQRFSFEEYQTMLCFQCGVNPMEGDAGISMATDRNYSSYVIDLHGLVMDNSS